MSRSILEDALEAIDSFVSGLGDIADLQCRLEADASALDRSFDCVIRELRSLDSDLELQHWFPGELEIIESDPPRRLVGSWQGEGTLRFELRPEGEGCALVFTHAFTDRDQAALAAWAGTAALPAWTHYSPNTQ